MSRCSLCDYSQSAPSLYNAGLPKPTHNNRVVVSQDYGYICTQCLDSINTTHDGFADPDRDVESADELEWDDELIDAPFEIETD